MGFSNENNNRQNPAFSWKYVLSNVGFFEGNTMWFKRFHIITVFILLLILVNTSLVEASWQIEGIDTPHQFRFMTDRSIAITDDGIVHIAYGYDHLYHAYHDGTWHIETVESSPLVGAHASIAVDSQGKLHIGYLDWTNAALNYATNTPQSSFYFISVGPMIPPDITVFIASSMASWIRG